jgi:hypothetical protein
MKTHSLNQPSAIRATVAFRVLRWIAIDAALGAASGVLFGVVFGAFGLLLNAQSWSIISVASYFALCGAVAGALVGACGAVLEGDDDFEPFPVNSKATAPRSELVTGIRDLPIPERTGAGNQSIQRRLHNRLVDVARGDQKPSRYSSRN